MYPEGISFEIFDTADLTDDALRFGELNSNYGFEMVLESNSNKYIANEALSGRFRLLQLKIQGYVSWSIKASTHFKNFTVKCTVAKYKKRFFIFQWDVPSIFIVKKTISVNNIKYNVTILQCVMKVEFKQK
jgi:hypothetical protein